MEIESIKRHASAPAGIKRLREENSIPGTNHCFLIDSVSNPQARGEAFVPRLLRVFGTVACRAVAMPGKCQPAREIVRVGIDADEIDEREVVVLFPRRS